MSAQKVIVVTGSTRGIGRGLAAEFLRRGHHVAISGRTQSAAERAATELASHGTAGARSLGIGCDVSRGEDLQRLWDETARTFGRVDIWINNAGISHSRQRAGEMREEDIRAVQETNLLGMMLATQVAMRGMQAQPAGGAIWNMEGFGSNGMMTPGMSLYGASKFALTYFNKALLSETRDGPVRICYLSPGIVITDLLKRDMGGAGGADWERTKRVYNILADRVETVVPFLADGILRNDRAGAKVAWLTGGKAARRFLGQLFRKRQVLTAADLSAG
jgi:NAD(P)-dependent dehydrogenase (short-subunit alcohol dehydrogenase family)